MAAAIGGGRAARAVIDARRRSDGDLAAAARDSASEHRAWQARPSQDRPRPTPRPLARMAAWEQAFDATARFGLGGAA